jgi:hypothetical protein
MITKSNYIDRIGFTNLPEELKKAHLVIMVKTDHGRNWECYKKDAEMKEVIDLAFQKLKEFMIAKGSKLNGASSGQGVKPNHAKKSYADINKEVSFINRFLEFHDKILYKKTFEIFINELQSSIEKKEISKKSPVAKEVMEIQQAVITAYNAMNAAKHFVLKQETIKRLKKIIEKHENAFSDPPDEPKPPKDKKKPLNLDGIRDVSDINIMPSVEFANLQFDTIGFKDKWLLFIGDPVPGFTAMVFALPKMGKSYLCVDFAGYLCRNHGKTLYVAKEEKLDATLQKKLKDKDVAHENLIVADGIPDDLSPYDFIFLDSVNKLGLTSKDLERLKVENPGKSFIYIFQTTKDGKFRGTNEFQHDVDVVIEIPEKGKAVQNGRFNQGGSMNIFPENEQHQSVGLNGMLAGPANGQPFLYVIDKNERGDFAAHVENKKGEIIFEFKAGGELSKGETSLFDDGWMKHEDDIKGLTKYLREMEVIGKSDWVTKEEEDLNGSGKNLMLAGVKKGVMPTNDKKQQDKKQAMMPKFNVEKYADRSDELNPQFIFSLTASQLLGEAIKGEFDLLYLAKRELANRGQDTEGKWIGFDKAKQIHEIE